MLICGLFGSSAVGSATSLVRPFHCNLSFFAAVSILLICFDAFTRGLSRLISHFLLFRWNAHLWTLRLFSCWLSHFTGQAFSLQPFILCSCFDFANLFRRIYKRTLTSHQRFP